MMQKHGTQCKQTKQQTKRLFFLEGNIVRLFVSLKSSTFTALRADFSSLTCVLHLCKLTLDPLLVLFHLNNKEPTKRRAATGDDCNAPSMP